MQKAKSHSQVQTRHQRHECSREGTKWRRWRRRCVRELDRPEPDWERRNSQGFHVSVSIKSCISFGGPWFLANRDTIYFDFEGTILAFCHHKSKVFDISTVEWHSRLFKVTTIGKMERIEWNDHISPLINFILVRDGNDALIQIIFPGGQWLYLAQIQLLILVHYHSSVNFTSHINHQFFHPSSAYRFNS